MDEAPNSSSSTYNVIFTINRHSIPDQGRLQYMYCDPFCIRFVQKKDRVVSSACPYILLPLPSDGALFSVAFEISYSWENVKFWCHPFLLVAFRSSHNCLTTRESTLVSIHAVGMAVDKRAFCRRHTICSKEGLF
ncbi:uncharacterized protein LOC110010572 [Jatropha curcas]|uniref:uncharacterized protein LOC110010572 n=1 Tax=Jatropha curcas TaxID=180498 RepID=UPI0018961F46|nr:uncharacterized protein LOC110010572 [Jatropha curcas]